MKKVKPVRVLGPGEVSEETMRKINKAMEGMDRWVNTLYLWKEELENEGYSPDQIKRIIKERRAKLKKEEQN